MTAHVIARKPGVSCYGTFSWRCASTRSVINRCCSQGMASNSASIGCSWRVTCSYAWSHWSTKFLSLVELCLVKFLPDSRDCCWQSSELHLLFSGTVLSWYLLVKVVCFLNQPEVEFQYSGLAARQGLTSIYAAGSLSNEWARVQCFAVAGVDSNILRSLLQSAVAQALVLPQVSLGPS